MSPRVYTRARPLTLLISACPDIDLRHGHGWRPLCLKDGPLGPTPSLKASRGRASARLACDASTKSRTTPSTPKPEARVAGHVILPEDSLAARTEEAAKVVGIEKQLGAVLGWCQQRTQALAKRIEAVAAEGQGRRRRFAHLRTNESAVGARRVDPLREEPAVEKRALLNGNVPRPNAHGRCGAAAPQTPLCRCRSVLRFFCSAITVDSLNWLAADAVAISPPPHMRCNWRRSRRASLHPCECVAPAPLLLAADIPQATTPTLAALQRPAAATHAASPPFLLCPSAQRIRVPLHPAQKAGRAHSTPRHRY
ncbi:hypothetical protein HYPSUDRAFT_207000 [Hypholoma sublateritium FD-334 SS-4]|uniref:Uncharacterized protein n=1 Tax=Hypholoma sublateritium (strain FD-334 SS-4) TaxID=945553 RepID=A0A0D2NIU2_HYPSF|nr:hypothetical protein HYPSUDRAFT_207000 [Hypholoma sublateritium FD-334 SS-4]